MKVLDLNPEQVLLAGDTHGNTSHWYSTLIPAAKKHEIRIIIQLGDFGYWVHQDSGQKYIKKLSLMLLREDLWLIWLPGNHENWDLLAKYNEDWKYLHKIAERIFYAPPGVRWTWQDLTFLAVGGAHSIDKDWRLNEERRKNKPRTLWWPDEMISEADIENAISGGRVDVLLAHDVPQGLDLQGLMWTKGARFLKADIMSELNRHRLRQIVDVVKPTQIFSGHYHVRFGTDLQYNFGNNHCRVNVFNCDETGRESWGIISLTRPSG